MNLLAAVISHMSRTVRSIYNLVRQQKSRTVRDNLGRQRGLGWL